VLFKFLLAYFIQRWGAAGKLKDLPVTTTWTLECPFLDIAWPRCRWHQFGKWTLGLSRKWTNMNRDDHNDARAITAAAFPAALPPLLPPLPLPYH
jgi:hypothetical protein